MKHSGKTFRILSIKQYFSFRHNVEQLQDFENKFKQQREANHLMRYRQFEHIRDKEKVQLTLMLLTKHNF